MTRVLVSAASAVVRVGLQSIIGSAPRLETVGIAGGSPALLNAIEELQPDVVLADLEQDERILESDLQLLFSVSGVPVVVLVPVLSGAAVSDALRAGARAILPRDAEPDEIVAAVEAVAAGLVVLHAENSDALLPVLGPGTHLYAQPLAESLTPREIEVLGMLAEGVGNKVIARRLGISEHTVKFHVGSILGKLNASSRTEAVTIGVRRGMIMV